MEPDDPVALDILRRARVARIATLSRNGRPSVNPLYFARVGGEIWLGTPEWTLAARNARAAPRVSLLFDAENDPSDHRVLRITGRATVRTDREAQRSYSRRAFRRYVLTPGGIRNFLEHRRLLGLMRRYHAQSADRGRAAVIAVTPERAELIADTAPS
ncbi:MAG TPA: pyridoxamine 5'-phosphate oxidase family protein [Acidimicrobiales bacterium]